MSMNMGMNGLLRQCSVAATAASRRSVPSSLPAIRQYSQVSSRHAAGMATAGYRYRNSTGYRKMYSTEAKEESSESKDSENGKEETKKEGKEEASGDSENAECLKKLKAKEEECVDLTSRLRYLQADFLNLQRNAAREKEQTKDFAISRFAKDLLETVDVLSLALKSVPESALIATDAPPPSSPPSSDSSSSSSSSTPSSGSPAPKSSAEYLKELHHGVDMIHRLLLQTLFKYGVKPFDPTGEAFDPNKHEALYQAPVPGKTPGTVIHCQKTGFLIKDRTLRAAQVGVASESS